MWSGCEKLLGRLLVQCDLLKMPGILPEIAKTLWGQIGDRTPDAEYSCVLDSAE